MRKSYKIIHQDEDIVVLDKAGHVLTIEDRFDPMKKNLRSMMANRFGEIYIVHRLDYETSGVIVFARNEASHKVLQEQFQSRTVKKLYRALTMTPIESVGIIEERIRESSSKKGKYITHREGKEALTKYHTIVQYGAYALLELELYTGRTHQIRVHLKSIGAPLLTDKKYGNADAFYLSQIKRIRRKKDEDEKPLIQRSSLHSYQLSIQHPRTKEAVTFTAELHKDMKAVLYQLKKKEA